MNIVEASDLRKTYRRGHVKALQGVTFSVAEGEAFGLIGPDGAGKTTLFRLLATLLLPDGGEARVDGHDVRSGMRAIRRSIGYMPGRFSLYQDMTVEENLAFFASVFHTTIEENRELVNDIYSQIEPFRTRRAGKLSGGMKQKLALCCALIHAPRLLLLDEPTTGVDPVSRREFWDMLGKIRRRHGISIIVSTPYMDEAVQCDRIALMQDGRFLQVDTPQAVIARYSSTLFAVVSDNMRRLSDDLRTCGAVTSAFAFGEAVHATVRPGTEAALLKEHLEARGHHDVGVSPISPTIEDCFMALSE